METTHQLARRNACEPIPANEPVISQSFQPYLTQRDYREYAENVPALSMRQPIFSVGMDILASDQRDLPGLSARRILAYLRSNYITLQVRVQKEPLSGDLFLHHCSLAGVAQYRATGLTQPPTEGLGKTLQNYRSLGLFLPAGLEPTAKNLRTLVLLHKSNQAEDAGPNRSLIYCTSQNHLEVPAFSAAGTLPQGSGIGSKYEYVFILARPQRSRQEQSLVLHTFVTSDRRQKLHYLELGSKPLRNDLCSFKRTILMRGCIRLNSLREGRCSTIGRNTRWSSWKSTLLLSNVWEECCRISPLCWTRLSMAKSRSRLVIV